jgi:3-oxoacyl-[acyl-carrier protein] reductase
MISDNPRVRPEMIPVGRFGTSEEVGEVAAMLAVNGYITGQTINVNGGLYMS